MSRELQIDISTKLQSDKTLTILKISGSLDAHTVTRMEETILKCLSTGQTFLIFDLSSLDYISSAGMGLLIGSLDEARTKGGDMIITGAKPNVFRVFQILGFDKIFQFFADIEAALNADLHR